MARANYVPKKTWNTLLSTSSTSTSFTGPAATGTAPSTNLFTPLNGQTLEFMPVGTGADDSTFDFRLISWAQTSDGLWVPRVILGATATLSSSVGVTAFFISDSYRFADTVVAGSGTIVQPTGIANTPQSAFIDVTGAELLQATFDLTGATAANLLWRSF